MFGYLLAAQGRGKADVRGVIYSIDRIRGDWRKVWEDSESGT